MAAKKDLTRETVLARLRAHESGFRSAGVGALFLFGSVARDSAQPDSDIDLFLDPAHDQFNLLDLVGVQQQAADILGSNVDVMTRRGINRHRRSVIETDAVQVF
jgi:predicted nucleotidyltransferase